MLDKNKSIVLFSGGQDSSACLIWALTKFKEVQTIGFYYGQRHNIELKCRKKLLKNIKLIEDDFYGGLSNDFIINLKEIKNLTNQKYTRLDIEKEIISFFKIKTFREQFYIQNKKIRKVTIFPISQSPLRSMPIVILNKIIDELILDFKIEVILDNKSIISNYIKKKITNKKIDLLSPTNLKDLCKKVE